MITSKIAAAIATAAITFGALTLSTSANAQMADSSNMKNCGGPSSNGMSSACDRYMNDMEMKVMHYKKMKHMMMMKKMKH